MPGQSSEARPPSDRYLAPRVIQICGLVLIIVAGIFWAVTERESTLFVGVGLSMILLGGYDKAHRELVAAMKRPSDGER